MKVTLNIGLLLLVVFMLIPSCENREEDFGAELVSGTELKIKYGFTASIITTDGGEELLIAEPDNPGIKLKQKEPAWRCTCGNEKDEGDCKIKTTEGSDIARCQGDCFCGFKKEPAPSEAVIKTKTPLQKTTDQ